MLGHLQRSDFSKPRAQLSIPSAHDMEDEEEEEEEGEEQGDVGGGAGSERGFRVPVATRLWGMRLAVQRGHEALYTVQEIHHLLSQPMITSNPQVNLFHNTSASAISLLSRLPVA